MIKKFLLLGISVLILVVGFSLVFIFLLTPTFEQAVTRFERIGKLQTYKQIGDALRSSHLTYTDYGKNLYYSEAAKDDRLQHLDLSAEQLLATKHILITSTDIRPSKFPFGRVVQAFYLFDENKMLICLKLETNQIGL